MRPNPILRHELRWSGLVVGQMVLLTLIWVAWGLLWEVPGLQPWIEGAGHQMEGLMVVTWLLTLPLLVAVALILGRAMLRGSAFTTRSARFRFHAASCYVATAACLAAFGILQRTEFRSALLALPVAILPAAVLLPFLYWPRLVFPSMSGLQDHADPPTPAAPHS